MLLFMEINNKFINKSTPDASKGDAGGCLGGSACFHSRVGGAYFTGPAQEVVKSSHTHLVFRKGGQQV